MNARETQTVRKDIMDTNKIIPVAESIESAIINSIHIEEIIKPVTGAIETTVVMPISKTVSHPRTTSEMESNKPLRDYVLSAVKNYFSHLGNVKPANVYDMVMREIEPPLLQMTLAHVRGNQSKAAKMLGLSRGTLRKKLKTYFIEH
jgi:Fis family transcriptional regulator